MIKNVFFHPLTAAPFNRNSTYTEITPCRQLERLFHEYVGITPKKLGNLIRYQYLWRDIVSEPDFNILNGVHRYGYADQSHLLREFKKYHSMDIQSAKRMALKDVGNIQDIPE